ncbi:MAG: nucleotidyltransferase family protein [Pseudomonadota bacterium]
MSTAAAEQWPNAWPLELRALVSCLTGRTPPPLDDDQWSAFEGLAVSRHRVAPLVLSHAPVDSLPEATRAALQTAEAEAVLTTLAQKQETQRLLTALTQAGVEAVMLKGWPLAERLYANPGARQAKDIDLHIAPADLPTAVNLLTTLGYGPHPGHETRVKLAAEPAPALLQETNDIALIHSGGHIVELHWRLTHLSGWLELSAIPSALEEHPLDSTGTTLKIPSDRASLIYLAVHGQLHLWGRLRWLMDIATLIEARDPAVLSDDLRVAEEVGAGRALRIAAALAARVFGTSMPPAWPTPNWLEARAVEHFLRLIAAPGGEPGQPHARLHYYLGIMGLGEGLTQRLAAPRYAIWRNLRLHLAGRRI